MQDLDLDPQHCLSGSRTNYSGSITVNTKLSRLLTAQKQSIRPPSPTCERKLEDKKNERSIPNFNNGRIHTCCFSIYLHRNCLFCHDSRSPALKKYTTSGRKKDYEYQCIKKIKTKHANEAYAIFKVRNSFLQNSYGYSSKSNTKFFQ
jgi:hypothetical protein